MPIKVRPVGWNPSLGDRTGTRLKVRTDHVSDTRDFRLIPSIVKEKMHSKMKDYYLRW